jgi:hypothetical protein
MRDRLVCFETTIWFNVKFVFLHFDVVLMSAMNAERKHFDKFLHVKISKDRCCVEPGTALVDWWKQHLRYRLFWPWLPNISQNWKEFVYLFYFFLNVPPCQMKEIFFFFKKRNFKFCVLYISCRFKFGFLFNQKNTKKKEGTNSWIFFYSFAYWFSRLFDNLHCVTQVCKVLYFCVSSFWFGQNSIELIG